MFHNNEQQVALTPTSLTQEKVEAISSGLTAFLPGCKKSVPTVTMLISLNHQFQYKKKVTFITIRIR